MLRRKLFALATLVLGLSCIQGAPVYTVGSLNGSMEECTLPLAINTVNSGLEVECIGVEDPLASIPTIIFVPSITAESYGGLPPITASCRIQGRSDGDRVTLTHTSSGALFFADGDGSQVLELEFLDFEGTTQQTTDTLAVSVMAEFLVASQLASLSIASCDFFSGLVSIASPTVDAASAIAVTASSAVSIDGCRFTSCICSSGALATGALLVEGGNAVSVSGTVFLNNGVNTAPGRQYGAVSLTEVISADFTDCIFDNNSAGFAALFVESDDLELTNCFFFSNVATDPLSMGGAIMLDGALMTFTCTKALCGFVSNFATAGGAIGVESIPDSQVLLRNLDVLSSQISISSNTALDGGGALIGLLTRVELDGPWVVHDNSGGRGHGGVFYCDQFFAVGGSSYVDNSLDEGAFVGQGGVVYAEGDVSIMDAREFLGNKARNGGGVVFSRNGDVSILNVVGSITDNDANFGGGQGEGGGVICGFSSSSQVELTMLGILPGSELSRNSAIPNGGVAYSGGTLLMSICIECTDPFHITENACDELGGVGSSERAATIMLGDTVSITLNTVGQSFGVGGAFFAGTSLSVTGGALFSQNGLGCLEGGSFWSLDVTIDTQGDILDHGVSFFGGAIFSGGDVTITSMGNLGRNTAGNSGGAIFAQGNIFIGTMNDVHDNSAVEDGGAFYAREITVNQVGALRGCLAEFGGVFYAEDQATVGLINGEVAGNAAQSLQNISIGSVLYTDNSLESEVTFGPNAIIENNTGHLVATPGLMTVNMANNAFDNNGGLFIGLGGLTLHCNGSTFTATSDPFSAPAAIYATTGNIIIDAIGTVSNSELSNAFFIQSSMSTVAVTSAAGDFVDNNVAALISALSVSFEASEEITFSGTTGSIGVAVDGMDFLAQSNIHIIGNGANAFSCIGDSEMTLALGSGLIAGNVVPVVSFVPGRCELELECGDIRDNIAGAPFLGIIDVFGGNAIVNIVSGSICSNTVADDASGLLVSTSTGPSSMLSASISVSTLDGDIANNVGGILFVPDSSCTITTVTYGVTNPNLACSVSEALSQPTSITITDAPPEYFDGQPFDLTIFLANVVTSVEVEVTFEGAGVQLFGPAKISVDPSGFATFFLVLSGTGTGVLSAGIRTLCEPLIDSQAIVVLPIPSASPSESPSPSASRSRSPSRSASFVPSTSPSKSPSNNASSKPIPTSNTPSVTASRSSNFASITPLAPLPDVPQQSPLPSVTPSPSSTASRSQSRSTLCSGDCVRAGVATVSDDDGDSNANITNDSGTVLGTVVLPPDATSQGEIIVFGPASPDAERAAEQLDVGSALVDITLVDRNGIRVQPQDDIEICLEVTDSDKAKDEGCLSFFDEDRNEWLCEDPCLDVEGNTACGTVGHLTNFAILFTGGGGSSGCGSDDDDGYIFDAGWKDGVMVGTFFGVALIIVLVMVAVGVFCPGVSDMLHGEEYRRIKQLRSGSSLYSSKVTLALQDSGAGSL